MATTGYDVLSGLKAVPVARPTAVTPASIAAAQAAVAATEKIAAKTETAAVRAADPLTNKSVVPPAPAGTTPVWVGGTTTGGWKFQSNTVQGPIITDNGGGQPTGSGGSTGPVTAATGPASTFNQNALQLLTSTLQGYGLSGDIASGITGLLQKGYTSDTIQAVIQDPNAVNNADPSIKSLATAWQTRFAANTARQKAGLAVLDPATYLATEAQYKSVMLRAGIPSAAISNNYIAQLMGVDVSPAEVQQRIDAATTAVTSEDPYVIQQLNQMGLGKGDLVFHLLDPNTASNIIQQKVQSAQISAEAARQNVNVNQDYAMQLAAQGITQNQAQQGFTNIASQIAGTQEIAQRYGFNLAPSGVGQALQAATFGTADAAAAQQELKRLQTQEVSAFGGSAGASQQGQSLGVGNQQGSI
jgi:hypothetical protein